MDKNLPLLEQTCNLRLTEYFCIINWYIKAKAGQFDNDQFITQMKYKTSLLNNSSFDSPFFYLSPQWFSWNTNKQK